MNDKLNDLVNNFVPETKKKGTKTAITGSFVKAGSTELAKMKQENDSLRQELQTYKQKFNEWRDDENRKWNEKYLEMEHSFEIIIKRFKETAQERDKLTARLAELENGPKVEKNEQKKVVGTSVAKLNRKKFTD